MVNRYKKSGGQAMVELVIVAGFVLVPLFLAIPLIGKYLDMRSSAVQAARYAAWERTVWYGGSAASSLGWLGASNFKNSSKALWQDRQSQQMLVNYDDLQNTIGSAQAPGTLNVILDPIANLAATLGPFTLEMKGLYSATVSMKVRDIDYDHFLLKNSTASFHETNVLLANGWSADGPDDPSKTSVKQQVKGLVPTSILNAEIAGVNVMEYVLKALSVFLPEASKLEPGKIEPDKVPADRLK
ncbi:MAG TPA: TadE family protein [Oxalicibacterium sp.]|nr:TadE family protein [Oxalicibacterium sp.]